VQQTVDAFTTVTLDSKEERTPVIFNNVNPFWAEELAFEDLESDFKRLSVVVWNRSDEEERPDQPCGQVLFPKALIASGQLEEEQWFSLSPLDPENSVSGDIRLKISYFPPKNDIKTHTFAVNVVSGRNLVPRGDNNMSNPYVVLHLLPDLRVKSTQLTKTEKNILDPVYNENFIL
jgi:Ca2+-dependent lipid-binding protein